jgi:hypothetical protein
MGVLVAFSAGCASRSESGALPGVAGVAPAASRVTTFRYTGTEQLFRVPAGVSKITVIAVGAQGAEFEPHSNGAYGGRVWAIIPARAGQRFVVVVGGHGSGVSGGFNGGADGGMNRHGYNDGFGGGGASDVRENGDRLSDRIIVAGGGGGQGRGTLGSYYGAGGKGGASTGGAGNPGGGGSGLSGGGGTGGTQRAGGRGGDAGGKESGDPGQPGANGSLAFGGAGGEGCQKSVFCNPYGGAGGGGGGGYYGGGGGGGGTGGFYSYGYPGGGGGGGSSYITPSAIAFHSWRGWRLKQPDGLVVISY